MYACFFRRRRSRVTACLPSLALPLVWLGTGVVAGAPVTDPLRLDPRIRPITQSLELELDPAADGYSGSVRVELHFSLATNRFRFHALELGLGEAKLDGQVVALRPEQAGLVSAMAVEPWATGRHVFELVFTNDFNRDGTGLYRTEAEGKPYLFTQMAPADARRAFPCWDEPGFKIPWRLTVTIPRDLEAVGNLLVAVTTPAGERKTVEFGRTPPMPSYLVALAVGPFESMPIAGQAVPGRIVTVAGRIAQGEMAAQEIPLLLSALEQYFGVPQPFPKLDHVAVPELPWGAMENAGAVFYHTSVFPQDAALASACQRNTLIGILAHEMSHMWFGNLVTMQWWDDVWLSEAFASWMSSKIVRQVHPELRTALGSYASAAFARVNDAQPKVKAVRRAFSGGDDLREAYDTLSYSKGEAILTMIEGWIGEAKFREALQLYFTRHAWGTVRSEDLWAAFGERGDPSVVEMVRRYVEQPGIPELTVRRLPGDRLQVRQQRYRSLVSQGVEDAVWWVPMVVRHTGPQGTNTVRLLLTQAEDVFEVPGLDQAAWVHPNAGESGYYYWNLEPHLTSMLAGPARQSLNAPERLGLLEGARATMRSGSLPAERVLELALQFLQDTEPEIQAEAVWAVERIRRVVPREDQPAYTRLVRRPLRFVLDEVGFSPKPQETAETESLRGVLLSQLGIEHDDPEVVAFCRDLAVRQLADPRSVPASCADVVLSVATWHGDSTWSARLRSAFEQAKDPEIRSRFGSLLAGFRDPVVVRSALDYGLTEAVKPTELGGLLGGRDELAATRFEWLVANYDAVEKKLPPREVPSLVFVVSGDDETLLAKGRVFFLDPARKETATEEQLAELADMLEVWTALRARYGFGLAAFIQARTADITRGSSGAPGR